MPVAPETAVYGAVVRPITSGSSTPCGYEDCSHPWPATWWVAEEQGDEDYGYYACDTHLAAMARLAILDAHED